MVSQSICQMSSKDLMLGLTLRLCKDVALVDVDGKLHQNNYIELSMLRSNGKIAAHGLILKLFHLGLPEQIKLLKQILTSQLLVSFSIMLSKHGPCRIIMFFPILGEVADTNFLASTPTL